MIRIELHGFGKEAEELKSKIFIRFKNRSYHREIHVEIYLTEIKDEENRDKPYIHFVMSRDSGPSSEEISRTLRNLFIICPPIEGSMR